MICFVILFLYQARYTIVRQWRLISAVMLSDFPFVIGIGVEPRGHSRAEGAIIYSGMEYR